MTETDGFVADPWAWLHESEADQTVFTAQLVTALIVTDGDEAAMARTEACLDALTTPVRLVGSVPSAGLAAESLEIAADLDTQFLWFLPAGCEPAPDALERLLRCSESPPEPSIVGPLLLQPRRRGRGPLVEEFGLTVTGGGRPITLAEVGDPYQGQLHPIEVLGVGLTGMLVQRSVFLSLGGFAPAVPVAQAGLEFGWRANLAGHRVLAEPSAHVVARPSSEDEAADRRWGLTLASTHSPRSTALTQLGLLLGSLVGVLAHLLGKDLVGARAEWAGLRGWLGGRSDARALRASVSAVHATAEDVRRTAGLRPGLREALRRGVDAVAGRVSDWAETFTERSSDLSLDDLTGDDFAGQARSRNRVSPVVFGGVLVAVLALIAGRSGFGSGALVGPQLLPAQAAASTLLEDYLRPIPGLPGIGAPGWLGLVGVGSVFTFGQVDWLVTLIMIGCVVAAWFTSFRLLRQVLGDGRVALLGGFGYALTPALIGGLNRGMFGLALFTVLLPMLGFAVLAWVRGVGSGWRQAGLVGLLLTWATSVVPLTWPIALLGALGVAWKRRSTSALPQVGLALAAPALLLVGPGWQTLLAFPGRLLTGTDPSLAPLTAPEPWQLLAGITPGGGLPPTGVSIAVFAVAWLAALLGAWRRPATAGWALLAAAAALVVAVVLTRLAVLVAPGTMARPQAHPWLVLLVGCLVLAGARGLDGLGEELAARDLGVRHALSLALVALITAATVLAAGWWAWAGESGLERRPVGALPAFVLNAQTEGNPGRTLAISVDRGQLSWALVEDDLPRLGDAERGISVGGDPSLAALAADVATRLAAGSADDALVGDLARLGVSNVWMGGGDVGVRMAISNTPGLGTGTGDDRGFTWPVPTSARALILDGEQRTPVADGVAVPAGTEGRGLVLAEPDDPRWWATLDGRPLTAKATTDGRQAFELGAASGHLSFGLTRGEPWWAWLQLAGLILLMLLALPEVRRRSAGPRRRIGGAS